MLETLSPELTNYYKSHVPPHQSFLIDSMAQRQHLDTNIDVVRSTMMGQQLSQDATEQ